MRTLLVLSLCCATAWAGAQTPPCLSANDVNDTPQGGVTAGPLVGANKFAFAIKPSAALVARGIRILTTNLRATASASLEIWSDDPTNQQPGALIARGIWQARLSATETWQGANLDRAVSLAAQTTYWIQWTERGAHTIPVSPNGSPTFATKIGNTVLGWSPGGAQWAWKFRLYCSPLDMPGATPFGTACANTAGSQGTLFTSEVPMVGNAGYGLEGSGFPRSAAALVLLGVNPSFTSIDLTSAGAPGCFLNTDILVVDAAVTGAGLVGFTLTPDGYVGLPVPIPNDGRLAGLYFALQVAVHDAASPNRLPFVTANAMRTRVR